MTAEQDTSRKGYAIFQVEITDWDTYLNEYVLPTAEIIEDHGGEVIISSPDPEVMEGEWDHSMTGVIEFPSVEDARACYNDPAYEELKSIRHESTEYANAIICPESSLDNPPS